MWQWLDTQKYLLTILMFLVITFVINVAAQSGAGGTVSRVIELEPIGEVIVNLDYLDTWQPTESAALDNSILLLEKTDTDALGLESRTAILAVQIVVANRALTLLETPDNYPFPLTVTDFIEPPEATIIDNRDAAIAIAELENGQTAQLISIELDSGIFAVIEGIALVSPSEEINDEILQMSTQINIEFVEEAPTSTATPIELIIPTIPPRDCAYLALVDLQQLTIINSEEANTGRDFDGDGDQVRIVMEVGPGTSASDVNAGANQEFATQWDGDLRGGDQATNLGSIERNICDANFGIFIRVTEDDSTPFGEIQTLIGSDIFIPIIVNNERQVYPEQITQSLVGESQDSSYEYELVIRLRTIQQDNVLTTDLTPTLPPTSTPTSTPTLTPSVTPTPTSTFTLTPSNTPTATATFTPSNTPTVTFTPTITPTPSITPTASDTPTPTITPTPSNTPTSTTTPTATLTPTDTPTSTLTSTPTITPTASDTPTPSVTPTASHTPTVTPTPTQTNCPGTQSSRLYPGMTGYLIPFGVSNRVRSNPTLGARQVGEIQLGGIFEILDGPVCQDGYIWYEVQYGEIRGWTVEGGPDEYWIAPLEEEISGDSICEAFANANASVNLRDVPGGELADTLSPGTSQLIVGQTTHTDGFTWWLLDNDLWVREDAVAERGNCDNVESVNP